MAIGVNQQSAVSNRQSVNRAISDQAIRQQPLSILLIQIARDVFVISLIFLFVLLVLEDLKSGFVSFYLDMKIILAVCALSGAIGLFTSHAYNSARADGRDPASGRETQI